LLFMLSRASDRYGRKYFGSDSRALV
jgi:hypothetical protein